MSNNSIAFGADKRRFTDRGNGRSYPQNGKNDINGSHHRDDEGNGRRNITRSKR